MRQALLLGLLLISSPTQRPYDLLITGGRVLDGTGNPWFRADLAIRGDQIAAVGTLDGAVARDTIRAGGLMVAPGFIDMLGQSEYTLLVDPRAESKVRQGVTTEITGEGSTVAPMSPRLAERLLTERVRYGLTIDWEDLAGYFHRLEARGTAINLGTYVGATQVRKAVIGFEDRPPTPAELKEMERLVELAMSQGAVGLSSSLVYAPAAYASTEELIVLARAASRYGGIYATHLRTEGRGILKALAEAFRIAREADIPVEIFHLKVSGRPNWGRMEGVIAAIEAARSKGLDITADVYPYVASATSLDAVIPPWAHQGGTDSLLARLRDPVTRERIRAALVDEEGRWRAGELGPPGPEGILIRSALLEENRIYEGKTLAEAAAMRGEGPIEALFNLLLTDRGETGAIYFSMNEADLRLALRQPWVSVGTDYSAVAPWGILGETKVHPRVYGTFPRFLGRYVREERLLPLAEAIRKITSLPAARLGLARRGLIRKGYSADLVLFDPETILDRATYRDPHQFPTGIIHVLVNGTPVVREGEHTGALPGRVLRGSGR